MLSFLPALLLLPLHFLLQLINLAFWALLVISLGVIKLLLPINSLRNLINLSMNWMFGCFGRASVTIIKLCNQVEWDCQIEGQLNRNDWYLMLPNHLSWLDIILLVDMAAGKIPAPKFFLKKELIWLPFVGLAAWALDMPFMRRYSRQFVERHPHLKGRDIETTRKSCGKYKQSPTTVINFVEGSRFTQEKHKLRNSRYDNLLPPKAGGIAFTLAAMGELFTNILDVTILYPENPKNPMMDMLSGRLNKVVIRVKVMPVSEEIVGDYYNDENFRMRFQLWLNQLWEKKDRFIDQLLSRSD